MNSEIQINKPTPTIPGEEIIKFDSTTDVRATIYSMKDGASVLITEFYSNGMTLLKELHKHLKTGYRIRRFQSNVPTERNIINFLIKFY